jgi:hypothetical protein
MSRYILLIANTIDWIYAACLEYFIVFSIDSSEARKQFDEYCLLIWPNGSKLGRKHRPCLSMDRDKISKLYREPFIDASYQISVHLGKRFQRRRFF